MCCPREAQLPPGRFHASLHRQAQNHPASQQKKLTGQRGAISAQHVMRLVPGSLLLLSTAWAAVLSSETPAPRALVLDGAQVVDGTGGAPIPSGRVVIQDGHIAAIGPKDRTPAPPDAERLDLSGNTIIPGLIDLHFHIEDDPRTGAASTESWRDGIPRSRPMERQVQRDFRKMMADDGLKGPRLFTCRAAHRRRSSCLSERCRCRARSPRRLDGLPSGTSKRARRR